jgi:hypothetical protein
MSSTQNSGRAGERMFLYSRARIFLVVDDHRD